MTRNWVNSRRERVDSRIGQPAGLVRSNVNFPVLVRGACAEALRYSTGPGRPPCYIGQLTKVGRDRVKRHRGTLYGIRASVSVGRTNTLLKLSQFKRFCPIPGCTLPRLELAHDTTHTLVVRTPLDGLPGCEANRAAAASGSAAAQRGGVWRPGV